MAWTAELRTPCGHDCGPGIRPGDRITRDAVLGWVHLDTCPDEEPVPTRPPCPRCFTIPSALGTCLCDD